MSSLTLRHDMKTCQPVKGRVRAENYGHAYYVTVCLLLVLETGGVYVICGHRPQVEIGHNKLSPARLRHVIRGGAQ